MRASNYQEVTLRVVKGLQMDQNPLKESHRASIYPFYHLLQPDQPQLSKFPDLLDSFFFIKKNICKMF